MKLEPIFTILSNEISIQKEIGKTKKYVASLVFSKAKYF